MNNNQELIDLIQKLRQENQTSSRSKSIKSTQLADNLVKEVSGGASNRGEVELFARWSRAAG